MDSEEYLNIFEKELKGLPSQEKNRSAGGNILTYG